VSEQDSSEEEASGRKEGRQNPLVHEPVVGAEPPYDHNAVADAKVRVLQPDGVTPVPRWNQRRRGRFRN
jgi:hypothetical protein